MAHFNECSHLVNPDALKKAKDLYAELLRNGKDPMDTMLEMQNSLQTRLAVDKPEMNQHPDKIKTCGQIVDWLRSQKDSIDDEFRELLTSLGGMSNGEAAASGVWKAWKGNNLELRNTLFDDLILSDQLEVRFEMTDITHFILNNYNVLGMSGEDIFVMYYLKNAENFARQDRGY